MSDEAAAASTRLTGDTNPDVRDWVTFNLGTQSSADTDAIQDALAARLDDDGGDTRFEAVAGLGRRGDPRALAQIPGRLADDTATIYGLDLAAAALAPTDLPPALVGLPTRSAGDDDPHTTRCPTSSTAANRPLSTSQRSRKGSSPPRSTAPCSTSDGRSRPAVTTRRLVKVRRPDGTPCAAQDRTLLWDVISSTEFDSTQQVESWTETIKDLAAADATDAYR